MRGKIGDSVSSEEESKIVIPQEKGEKQEKR